MTTITDLDEIFENIKPLNHGRRLIFQKYCEYLVENKQIDQSYVDKYLTKEFLYEDQEEEEFVKKGELYLTEFEGKIYECESFLKSIVFDVMIIY